MSSYAPTSVRARSSRGVAGVRAVRESISARSVVSRASASLSSFGTFELWAKAVAAPRQIADTTRVLAQLRIDLLEVAAIDEHLARLAARAWRDEPFRFHHV